jgi:hypothetical protein
MNRNELERLMAINYAVGNALKGKKVKTPGLAYAETLAGKLLQHALTAYALWTQNTRLQMPGMPPIDFVDWSSINVLARTCIETYIACHYVFLQPSTPDESDFRYNAWMLAGFVRRESFPTVTEKGAQQIVIDAQVNQRHRRKIQNTVAFGKLSTKQQKAVLSGRDWHPGVTMSEMADTVFGPRWGRALYAVMSSHAHADGLSAVQIKQAVNEGEMSKLAAGAVTEIGVVLAYMTASYAGRFVKAGQVYRYHPDHELNEKYANLADYASKLIGEHADLLRNTAGDSDPDTPVRQDERH